MSETNHCVDCCCARSWKALKITEYTGKSIPEHIEMLMAELEALRRTESVGPFKTPQQMFEDDMRSFTAQRHGEQK